MMTSVDSRHSVEAVVRQCHAPRVFLTPTLFDLTLVALAPAAVQILAVPIAHARSVPGVLWAVLHDGSRRFADDDTARLLDLSRVCAAAWKVAQSVITSSAHLPDAQGSPQRSLSGRERQVCRLVAAGFTNKQIATQLRVGIKSVETYRARIADKLGFRGRADFVAYVAGRR
jgi:DNA-binding CsgD family transcriptional regulator